MKSIIIDTDPGHDDALAIMLAIKSGIFDVKAITTVAGNSNIENCTSNARYILRLLDREKIPIYSGASKPLNRELITANVHGESGLAGIKHNIKPELTNNAVDKILEILENSKEKVTLVTLGPLTNIALAIRKNHWIMEKIEEIVMMGGAIRVPGNKNRVAEFNFFVDPEAADIVFSFPVRKKLIPLDPCNNVRLQMEDFEKIHSNLREPLLDMMKEFIEGIYKYDGVKAALVYDALAVYSLINEDACKIKSMDVKIETQSDLTRGMSVADLRLKSDKELNVDVVEYIDSLKFNEDFITILNR